MILTVGLLIVKFKVPNKVNLKFENQICLKYHRFVVAKQMTVGEEEVITLLAIYIENFGIQRSAKVGNFDSLRSVETLA